MPRWTFIKILLTSTVIYKHFCVENEFVQYLQNYKYYNRVLINKEKTRVWQPTDLAKFTDRLTIQFF